MQTSFFLTHRHTDILLSLYRFRFLTRSQLQALLNHKHHNRIVHWLHDLIDHKYVQVHDNLPIPVYSLGTNGRRYLKDKEGIELSVVNRVWRNTQYSYNFQKRCLSVADIFLSLRKTVAANGGTLHFMTKAEMSAIEGLINPAPDAYIAIEKPEGKIDRYFIEVFDTIPLRIMRKRIQQYIDYYDSGDWQASTDKPFPAILLVCPDRQIKKRLRQLIQSSLEEDTGIEIILTTKDLLKESLLPAISQTGDRV